MAAMANDQPLGAEHVIDIAMAIILSVVTCGLYNLYWNYRQFHTMNQLLGRHEYDFVKWLLLSLISCGLFHIYYEYKMGVDLQNYLTQRGVATNQNLAILGLVLSCFGLTVVADAIYQHWFNQLAQPKPPAPAA